ncbi:MAG: STAS domain-containing protein [Pseudomonadota bacterium]|nr:STAS domain-containing protein [Pseudomonadota bacterium]
MNSTAVVNANGHWHDSEARLVLPAQLTIDALAVMLKKNKWLGLPVKQVDFSQVEKADSAILAVLLVWASNTEEKLQVKQLPEELYTLVKLYDLDSQITLI